MKINKILAAGIAATLAVTSLSAVVGAETKTAEFEMATSEATFKFTKQIAFFKDNKKIISGRLAAAEKNSDLASEDSVAIVKTLVEDLITDARKQIDAVTAAIEAGADKIAEDETADGYVADLDEQIAIMEENLAALDGDEIKYTDALTAASKIKAAAVKAETIINKFKAGEDGKINQYKAATKDVLTDVLVQDSTKKAGEQFANATVLYEAATTPASVAGATAGAAKLLAEGDTMTLSDTTTYYVVGGAVVATKTVATVTNTSTNSTVKKDDIVAADSVLTGAVGGSDIVNYTATTTTYKAYQLTGKTAAETIGATELAKYEEKLTYKAAPTVAETSGRYVTVAAGVPTLTAGTPATDLVKATVVGTVKGGTEAATKVNTALDTLGATLDGLYTGDGKGAVEVDAYKIEKAAAAADADAGDLFTQGCQINIEGFDDGPWDFWKEFSYVPVKAKMVVTGKPTDSNTQVTKTYDFKEDDYKINDVKTGAKSLNLWIDTDKNIVNKNNHANLNVFDKITDCYIEVTFEHSTSDENVYKVNNGTTINMSHKYEVWADHYATDACYPDEHPHVSYTMAITKTGEDDENMNEFADQLMNSEAYHGWDWAQPTTEMKEYQAFLEKTTDDTTIYRQYVKLLSRADAHTAQTITIHGNDNDDQQTFVDATGRGTAPRYFAGLASQVADFFNKKDNGKITFQFTNLNASSSWKSGGVPSTEVGLKNALAGTSMGLFFNYNQSTGSLQSLGEVDADAGTITFDISEVLDDMGGFTKGNISDIYYGLNKGIEYKSQDYTSIHATDAKDRIGKNGVNDYWYYSTKASDGLCFAIGYIVDKVTLSYEDGDVDAATDTDTDTDATDDTDTDTETVEDTDDDEDEDEDEDEDVDEDEDDDYDDEEEDYADDDDDADDDMDDDDVDDDDDSFDDDLSDDDLADDDLAEDDDDIVEDDAADDIAIEDDDIDAVIDQDDTAETDVENDVDVIVVPTTTDDDANPGTGVGLAVIPAIVAAAAIAVSKKRK